MRFRKENFFYFTQALLWKFDSNKKSPLKQLKN